MKHKRKTTHRRKRGVMSAAAPRRHRKTHTTRRRRSHKKAGLSEMFNHATAMAAARSLGSAAIGGVLANSVNKLTASQPPYQRIGTGILASFLTYAVGGFPYMAAGMAGAFSSMEIKPVMDKLLGEGEGYYDYASPTSLNEMPIYLNENGEAIYLNENGDVTLAEEIYLSEGIYPDYSTQY